MKHWLVVLALLGGALFFATRQSAVERLMAPVTGPAAANGGSKFVDLDPKRLPVTPAHLVQQGTPTIVYFHDKTCANCVQMDRDIEDFLVLRPDVAVRKVSISVVDGAYYNAIRDFRWKVYMSPSVIIFDRKGKMVAADEALDDSGSELLHEWMAAEADKAARPQG